LNKYAIYFESKIIIPYEKILFHWVHEYFLEICMAQEQVGHKDVKAGGFDFEPIALLRLIITAQHKNRPPSLESGLRFHQHSF